MGLILYKSNRLEQLFGHLVEDVLRTPLSSPFRAEQVVVQTQGMAQWLTLEICRSMGVTANIEFCFPRKFLGNLFDQLLPVPNTPIEPEALTWRIMATLDSMLGRPEFEGLRNYLETSPDPRRRFQLSERIARLFDEYSVYRPERIDAWIKGQEGEDPVERWQAALWRESMTGDLACQGKFLFDLNERLLASDLPCGRLPERLSVFGAGSLPPVYLKMFEALGRLIPVHLFCLSPCQEYWGDISSVTESRRLQEKTGDGSAGADAIHVERGNPILAACGKAGREFLRLVTDLECQEVESYIEPEPDSLLRSLQCGMLQLRDTPDASEAGVKRGDRSVQVHSCHSPLRELQVLRDHLLDWFAHDETLSPGNVLVMLPDIEAYAPFVGGVFDPAEAGAPAVPYTLAGQGARGQSPMVDAFVSLLRLPSSRWTTTGILTFFETSAVRRRFGIEETDLPQIRQWIQGAGIHWGRDAAHREELGLPAFSGHTWEEGRDRWLLGYAMDDEPSGTVGGLWPCAGIEGTSTELLGRWLDFQEQLFATLAALSEEHTLEGWAELLNDCIDGLFQPDAAGEVTVNRIRQVIHELRQQQQASGFGEAVALPVVLERLLPKFEEAGVGKVYLRGRVTFCGLRPLRCVPFRVVCMLGMQDGSFPRHQEPVSFDLMARNPREGDQSRRDEDRFLFLESVLSARDTLYLSYVGQSVRDNSARLPSVVLSELLDYIGVHYHLHDSDPGKAPDGESGRIVDELILTRHPLHPFSRSYFRADAGGDPRLFGYSEAQARISSALGGRDGGEREIFMSDPLAKAPGENRTIQLEDLKAFFRNPSRFFVQRCLEFRLPEDQEPLQEEEPFVLDGLHGYQCRQETLEASLAPGDAPVLEAGWHVRNWLPSGAVGKLLANDMKLRTGQISARIREQIDGPVLKRERRVIQIDVGTTRIEGELRPLVGGGILHYRPSGVKRDEKPGAHLSLWIEHLLWQLCGENGSKESCLIGEDGRWSYVEEPRAMELLASLVEVYWKGQERPLRFFPRSSFASVEGRNGSPRDRALKQWEASEFEAFGKGESEDPYMNLCFRNDPDPLGEEFEELAGEVFRPMMANCGKAS